MTGLLKIDSTLDLLLRMRERLSDPNNWCQNEIQIGDKHCLIGTAKFVAGCPMDDWNDAAKEIERLFSEHILMSAADFNDSHNHAQVLKLLDSVIAARVC